MQSTGGEILPESSQGEENLTSYQKLEMLLKFEKELNRIFSSDVIAQRWGSTIMIPIIGLICYNNGGPELSEVFFTLLISSLSGLRWYEKLVTFSKENVQKEVQKILQKTEVGSIDEERKTLIGQLSKEELLELVSSRRIRI